MRVLIVDDSAAVRSRLAAMIGEQDGVTEVIEAGDGDEALAIIGRQRLDVVILDLHLPGTNGLAVLGTLGRATQRPRLVVLTNDATELHRRECTLLGADHFFDKSSEFDRVVALMVELGASAFVR